MISGVSKVVIEVGDQERAKAFWIETMGFGLVQDAPYGDERWLEVGSPDGATRTSSWSYAHQGQRIERSFRNIADFERDVPLR